MELSRKKIPKDLRYTRKLLLDYGRKGSFWHRIKKQFKGNGKELPDKREHYTKKEWKAFLHHKNSSSADNYLKKLEKKDILYTEENLEVVKDKQRIDTYKIDVKKLRQEFNDMDYIDFFQEEVKGRSLADEIFWNKD